MKSEDLQRKISAILSADAVGYSRLMGEDEEATVQTLRSCRALMATTIGRFKGRVVDSPGDNLLAEFPSMLDAVRCAVEIQEEIHRRNSARPENRRMWFRIGINLGDIIVDAERIYGDGVNIAARLESMAAPGGVHLSGSAYEQVKHKLPYRFEFAGEHKVKNIRDPLRSYRVVMDKSLLTAGMPGKTNESKSRRIVNALWLAAAVLILAFAFYHWVDMHARSLSGKSSPRSIPDPSFSRKTAIALLPFKNLSGDPEQEYFSDGISNDIITNLSRFRNLMVIASNTVFAYKGKSLDIQKIGQELGLRYVLEGSVQKLGSSVRINAQLIDVSNGAHVWAERYVRDYRDIFQLQGEIVQAIVAKLAINISQAEQLRAMRKRPQDLQAYDYLLQGWAHYQRRTQAANVRAGELFAQAIAIDPAYAAAYVGLGWVDYAKVSYGWTEFPHQALAAAFANGRKALGLDKTNAAAHTLLCNVYTFQNEYELAIREAEQAIELNPNDAQAFGQLGWSLLWAGRVDEAVSALELSLRLDSTSPTNAWFHLGMAYYLKGRYADSLEILERGLVKRPEFAGYHLMLAATYAQLHRPDEASRAAQTLRRLDPFFELQSFGTAFRDPSHREAILAGLRKAGLQ